MFLSEHIPALFKKGTLKLMKDGAELKRVAEAQFLIEPFPAHLARELGEDIAGHLFEPDGVLRDELESIDLRVRAGLQRVTFHHHEDIKATAVIEPVSIKDCSATRIEDDKSGKAWLSFSFVLVFDLSARVTRNFVIDEFGNILKLSFERLQLDLLDEDREAKARIKESAARLVGNGIDSVTITHGSPDGSGGSVTLTQDDAKRLRQEASDIRKFKAH